MIKFLEKRLNKTLRRALDNETNRNKYLLDFLKETIEDSIYTLNEIQAVDKLADKTESEKRDLRNAIIEAKRSILVDKIIELDTRSKKSLTPKNNTKSLI